MRVYGPADVVRFLDMPGCIAAVREAMAMFSADAGDQPLRQIVTIAPGDLFGLMPGSLAAPGGFGAKVISVFADRTHPEHSHHRGVVLLFDRAAGELRCVADAAEITGRRTAAASAVATDALARRDARRLAIFGTGTQARSHLSALLLVRDFEEIWVWGRCEARARALIDAAGGEIGVPMRFVADAREAARADVICTVTGSATPVLLGEWVQPGTHVNIVGSSYAGPVEVDGGLVAASRYFADSRASVLAAGAEFLAARAAGLIDDAHIVGEIGDVLNDTVAGRTGAGDITLYKSLGHIVQDLAAAAYIDDRARGGRSQSELHES